jgi:hypothetical protein
MALFYGYSIGSKLIILFSYIVSNFYTFLLFISQKNTALLFAKKTELLLHIFVVKLLQPKAKMNSNIFSLVFIGLEIAE